MGNVTYHGRASSSNIFTPNFNDILFLRNLDFLYSFILLNLEEYSIHNKEYGGTSLKIEHEISKLSVDFSNIIRPKLISLKK